MKQRNNTLAVPATSWKDSKRSFTLLDMNRFLAGTLLDRLHDLEQYCELANKGDPSRLCEADRDILAGCVNAIMKQCEDAQMEKAWAKGESLIGIMFELGRKTPPTYQVVASAIEEFHREVIFELREKLFVFVPLEVAKFYEKDAIFGEQVNASFPSAKPHIKDAGTCMAMDLHTASVFHLMIASEFGLRSLAKRLRVKVNPSLEYADWGKVINAIKQRLNSISPRSKKGQAEVEFYRKTMDECDYFKEVWRNNVFHARQRPDRHVALQAFEKVREFMQRLAAKGFRERVGK